MPTDKKTTPKIKLSNLKKPKESRAETFIRLAQPRVKNVLRSLRILGNCSNTSNYEYTSEQIEKMFDTILEFMNKMEAKFSKSKNEQESFSF